MAEILEEVYRYFLRQASATARLAERQLAFERQAPTPGYIEPDYWTIESRADYWKTDSQGENTPDRRGLTGSARLLQDLTELEQYAFETDRKKIRISRTLSLASLDPYGFEQFRRTGEFEFGTPMELFDRRYPGHYLRLVKGVNASVVALSPQGGIGATLTASGKSRVVTGGDVFRTRTIARQPETITLSAPASDGGLVGLRPEDAEKVGPFEGMGVDTTWRLSVPKAANLELDYDSIADVLLTIEYTALDSADYRQQVISGLDSTIEAQRVFSLRNDFADEWYDLNNWETTDEPLTVRFSTDRADFPSNIDDLAIERVKLAYVPRDDVDPADFGSIDTTLRFAESDSDRVIEGGEAPDENGLVKISTERVSPSGEWTLSLPTRPEVTDILQSEQVDDVLVIFEYSGQTPDWPEF
jgi:hypothetical protein